MAAEQTDLDDKSTQEIELETHIAIVEGIYYSNTHNQYYIRVIEAISNGVTRGVLEYAESKCCEFLYQPAWKKLLDRLCQKYKRR